MEMEKLNYVLLKFQPGSPFPDLLQQVKKAWDRVMPDYPFETILLDDHFRHIYSWMDKVYVIMTILNTVILFVACLGLLGLVSFAVERRTKEVGIRKVMGASIASIFTLISREFILLVTLANLAGILLGAWIVERMFRMMISYNRVDLDAGIYVLTVVMTLGATLLAISWEIGRAARANPVDSLRYE
jgi:putative ABC transport system permease protein